MKKKLFALVAAALFGFSSTAQAQPVDPAQLSSDIQNQVNAAVADAQQRIQSMLPAGSSGPIQNVVPPVWAPREPQPVANGTNGEMWVDTRWGPRRFLIWVPQNYNPANPTPVFVGIPAYQDTSENYRNYSRLRESTAGREAIIVYPDSWHQSWEGAPTSLSEPGQDIEFIRQVIDRTEMAYNVDRHRLYATGMSTGSGMAAILGCHASDLFAAIAPVSGAYYDTVNMGCQNNPMPILIVHGMSDEQHHYDGGVRYGWHYYGPTQLMDIYVQRNRCSPARTEFPIGYGATKVIAEGCAAPTEHIRVPGGHLWWYRPDTAEEIWAFLRVQRR